MVAKFHARTSLALAVLGVAVLAGQGGRAENVTVKYRGEVNLSPFTCNEIDRSSFVRRICYDAGNQYMLINLNGTYYHYCEIDGGTVTALLHAESVGRFYNSSVKGRFDCRSHRVPNY
jgi:KTSC domain